MTDRILRARAVFVRPGLVSGSGSGAPEARLLDGGALWIRSGRVVRTLASAAAATRAARRTGCAVEDLGDTLLVPGLVNAHAHLELSGLAGSTRPGASFGAWVGQVLARRAERGPARLARDAAAGALDLLRGGTTTVGDIDTTGAGERGLADSPIRSVLFRELLDAQDPGRTAGELERVRRALPRRARRTEGLAPHAPFTASPELLRAVARIARRRRTPVSVHWSETPEELEWMRSGTGPLAAVLGPSPRQSGLDAIESAGLLNDRLVLVHGNLPQRGEPQRIAAAGATLVHCPGTHAWFSRERFALGRYLRAGVRLALGTDSAASNESLDMRRELRLLLAAHRSVSPLQAFDMATLGSARALGLESEVGDLRAGARADVVALGPWRGSSQGAAAVNRALAEVIEAALEVSSVRVGGKAQRASDGAPRLRPGSGR